jgi:hypothetical protein
MIKDLNQINSIEIGGPANTQEEFNNVEQIQSDKEDQPFEIDTN